MEWVRVSHYPNSPSTRWFLW